jgi:hypothetical protein
MGSIKLFLLGQFLVLLVVLLSCQRSGDLWKCDTFGAHPKCSLFHRLHYSPPDPYCNLEFEIIESKGAFRIFLNVYSLPLECAGVCENRVYVKISTSDECLTLESYLYQGGQRVLLPSYSYDWMMDNLLQGNAIFIEVGRYTMKLLPSNFSVVNPSHPVPYQTP